MITKGSIFWLSGLEPEKKTQRESRELTPGLKVEKFYFLLFLFWQKLAFASLNRNYRAIYAIWIIENKIKFRYEFDEISFVGIWKETRKRVVLIKADWRKTGPLARGWTNLRFNVFN